MEATRLLLATCIYPDSWHRHSGTFVHQWAKQLGEAGFQVEVFKRDHITFGTYLGGFKRLYRFYQLPRASCYSWEGITVHRQGVHLRLPLNYSWNAPRITYNVIKPRVYEIHERFPFDVAYLATWGDFSLAMSRIAREMGIPYVAAAIGSHDNDYYNKPKSIYFKFHREIYENSRLVVCVSEDLNRKVRIMTDGLANTFTFYSGVDTSLFSRKPQLRLDCRRRLGYTDAHKVILHTGRIEEAKGVYELVEAFAWLARSDASLRLLLVGWVAERLRLQMAIRRHGLQSKVTLTGAVGHEEVPGYMNAADIFVLASWMEGLPNVIMEACACELPVVASAVGGVPEVVEDGATGLLTAPRRAAELAQRLAELLGSDEKAARLGRAARDRMVSRFDSSKNGALLAAKIRDVLVSCANSARP